MKIPHPFEFVPAHHRKLVFMGALVLSLVCMLIFQVFLEPPLRTTIASMGIVSFELAGNIETTRAILGSWNQTARLFAAFGLGFDYLFIICYTFALGLGTLLASSRLEKRYSNLGKWLGIGICLAAIFDSLENIFLTYILVNGIQPPFPMLATVAATFKFTFILAGLFYSLMGWLMPRRPRSSR